MQPVSVLDIARRFEENPLLSTKDIKPSSKEMVVESLLNPGVFRFNRKIWLLMQVSERPQQTEGFVRVARRHDGEMEILQFAKNDPELDLSDSRIIRHNGIGYLASHSHLRLMCREDGENFQEAEDYNPIFGESGLETFGIEDCRIAEINDIFYLTYSMVSPLGAGVGLIQTRDWKRFERKGMILPPHNQYCAIFEEKVRDRYYALHCPSSPQLGGNYLWIAESPDAMHWGHHKCIAKTRQGMWDSARVGAGCSPIRTPQGWLAIYHGADEQNRSCLGALLLDIKDPSHVIARSQVPLLEPGEPYELSGFPGDSILTGGHLVIGDKLRLYYSASDKVICGAELSIHEILGSLSPANKDHSS